MPDWKDPLLARWWAGCSEYTRSRLPKVAKHPTYAASPANVLGWLCGLLDPDMRADTLRLRSLIDAELREGRAAKEKALELAVRFGGIDGEHHKAWVIDQMVRVLAGDGYEQLVAEAKAGEDGPETYDWDEGIAP
jgi:hypothetical protein